MRIQTYLVVWCFIILLSHLWRRLFPTELFIETHCVIGEVTMASSRKKVVDCISCSGFPIQRYQSGKISVTNGDALKMEWGRNASNT
jgi:hypothetical protein